LFRLVSAID
jgi:hypothetical protein